jgi:hypothetical protein
MIASTEVVGYRMWTPVRRDDEIVLKAYFTDYVWESRLVGGLDQAPPNRDLTADEWISGEQGSDTVGYFACSKYDDLLSAVSIDDWALGIHGAVALSGDMVSEPDEPLRAQSARIVAFRDELPCWTCLDTYQWVPGIVSWLDGNSGVGSGCEAHAHLELERAGHEDELVATTTLLRSIAERYEVPLVGLAELEAL